MDRSGQSFSPYCISTPSLAPGKYHLQVPVDGGFRHFLVPVISFPLLGRQLGQLILLYNSTCSESEIHAKLAVSGGVGFSPTLSLGLIQPYNAL